MSTTTCIPVTLTYVGLCSRGWYWEVARADQWGSGYCTTRSGAWGAARRWARRNL